jgi:pectin methylesterase-like acyl-CoA thioesterase
MAVLSVGPGKTYLTITAAVAAAQNGDTVEVQAGTYTNQYVSISKNITLQGVGGMVKLPALKSNTGGEG